MVLKVNGPWPFLASKSMVLAYLARLGVSDAEAESLIQRQPSEEDLTMLYKLHITSVPFENLGQHTHPEAPGAPAVPRCDPVLDVETTLKKIVFDRRGGFCYELNFAFAWLLRTLGYSVRVGCSNVITPGGPVPGHLVLLVDQLGPCPFLVDPGFGDMIRTPYPAKFGAPVRDQMVGDEYVLRPNTDASAFGQSEAHAKRFDAVLMRRRSTGISSSPMVDLMGMPMPPPAEEMGPEEPVYLLNLSDDLGLDSQEFLEGIASVLLDSEHNMFSQKRFCFRATDDGFLFAGQDYLKQVRHGVEVKREKFDTEAAYRACLRTTFGVVL